MTMKYSKEFRFANTQKRVIRIEVERTFAPRTAKVLRLDETVYKQIQAYYLMRIP